MAYQLVKKPREIPAGSYENMDAPASNTQAVGGAYGLEQPGLGDALESQMQARMAQLTGLLEVQKKSEAPKLSGPAQELSTAAMARAMKTQKGEMR